VVLFMPVAGVSVVAPVPGVPAVAAGVPGAVGSLMPVLAALLFLRWPNQPLLRGAAPFVACASITMHEHQALSPSSKCMTA